MELIIAEPLFLPSLLKSHHHHHYYPLPPPHSENSNYGVKLRNRPMNIYYQEQSPLTIEESRPVRIKSCNLFHSLTKKSLKVTIA